MIADYLIMAFLGISVVFNMLGSIALTDSPTYIQGYMEQLSARHLERCLPCLQS